MADIDATAILAAVQLQSAEAAAPTDESLNAGCLLPDEPIADVLTNEVATDVNTVLEMIPKLSEETVAATESIYNALTYIRDDLTLQRGMSQYIATEAIAVLPNFGRHKPVNFYSRHPSNTGYQAAVEEIDSEIANDLLSQLHTAAVRLEDQAASAGVEFLVEKMDFQLSSAQVVAMHGELRQLIQLAQDNGFDWNDLLFQTCATDPTQTVNIPVMLTLSRALPYSFANMDNYYMVHLEAPAMLEAMERHLREWNTAFGEHLAALKTSSNGSVTVTLPQSPSITFAHGKATSIDNIADVFKSAADKLTSEPPQMDTLVWVKRISDSAEQSKVVTIIDRAKAYNEAVIETANTLRSIIQYLTDYDRTSDQLTFVTDGIYKLTSAFVRTQQTQREAYREVVTWCLNASVATSFATTLAYSTAQVGWKAINQCKATLQMPEGVYTEMEVCLKNMQSIFAVTAT